MIKDPIALSDAQKAWQDVRAWQGRAQRAFIAPLAQGAIVPRAIGDLAHNVPFIFAYGVLNEVLGQLRNENLFACRTSNLGPLMGASRPALSWVDYALVDKGRDRRNELAHDGVVVPRGEIWTYVDAIEAELLAWKIMPAAIPFIH